MRFRREKRRRDDPDQTFREARAVMTGLRSVVAEMREHLDELETEVRRQPDTEEV